MSTQALIKELKENNEDFEFYPTTKEMVKVIFNYLNNTLFNKDIDILDIGCGTCNFKKYFNEFVNQQNQLYNSEVEKYNKGLINVINVRHAQVYLSEYYVIEKSTTLLQKLDKDVIVLGTDFNTTMLIDKPVEYIFCNPPYSEYEKWTCKILDTANAKDVFLIIPTRWRENKAIQGVIDKNKLEVNILDTTDFTNADRQARAKVDIIHVKLLGNYRSMSDYNERAFSEWFDNTFKFSDDKHMSEFEINKRKNETVKQALVNTEESKAKILVELYNKEMQTLSEHFQAICSLDSDVLSTIGVTKDNVIKALKEKALGTKARYWQLALDELEEITTRLTSSVRKQMLQKFKIMQRVDFTMENIYPLILYVIKNAKNYCEDQLIDFYKSLTAPDNIKKYKSNEKVFKRNAYRANWFDNIKEVSHYILDYRIITTSPFETSFYDGSLKECEYNTRIQDILVVAKNLGFHATFKGLTSLNYGEKNYIYLDNSDTVFMEYKIYKNGNMHVKFNLEFMRALNVEAARLLGWIQSKEDIQKEFPEEMAKGAEKYFKSNYNVLSDLNNRTLLLTVSDV